MEVPPRLPNGACECFKGQGSWSPHSSITLRLACVCKNVCLVSTTTLSPLVQIDFLSNRCQPFWNFVLDKDLKSYSVFLCLLFLCFCLFVVSPTCHIGRNGRKIMAGNYCNFYIYIYILLFFYFCFAIFIFLYYKMLFCSIMVIMPVLNNAGIFTSVWKHYYSLFYINGFWSV